MSDQDKLQLMYKSLEKYPASLDTEQVAEALGVTRRTVERLFEAGKIKYFVLETGAAGIRPTKRVTKADLIEFMM